MRFLTTVLLGGKTATGLPVPAEVVEALGAGRKPAVTVTIGPYSYRSTIATMNGQYMLPFSAEHRTATGIEAGDEVEVDLELDTAPRELSVPEDLAAALDAAPAARAAFDALSYSNRRRFTLSVDDAKTPETRQRRIAKTVETLLTP